MNLSPKILELREKARQEALRRVQSDRLKAPDKLHPILDAIADNLLNPQLNVSFVERTTGTDWRERQMFPDYFGMPIERYLLLMRELMGKWLLKHTSLTITAVAKALDYVTTSNFSNDFRKWTGQTPTSYRRQAKGPGPNALHQFLDELLGDQPLWIDDRARAEIVWRFLRWETQHDRRRLLKADIVSGSAALFELLSEESRKASNRDVHQGLVLAEDALIHVKASRAFLGDRFGGLYALALARLGNAQCLAGKLASAQKSFNKSWESWAEAAQKDQAVEAEILSREANLRIFQRNFPGAYELLDRSFSLALELKDIPLQVNIHLQRAGSYGYSGEPWKMPAELEAAKRKLSDHTPGDRQRLLWVNQDLLFVYIDVGAFSKADKLMPETEALACELNYQPSLHRLAWIKGLLSKEREEGTKAEQFLREARAGLSAQGDLDATAVVGLDLAVLYHKQGRTRDVRRTVVYEVLPALDRLHHSEAVAAFKLLQESIDGEVTVEILERAYALLRKRRDPHDR